MAEPAYLTSPKLAALGIKHGWFTRSGGVSLAEFASLNVKKGLGDPDEHVENNRRSALSVLGLSDQNLVYITHLHGDKVLIADRQMVGTDQPADAVLTDDPTLVLGQGTADCGTLILAASDRSVVGLIHASWRTLREGIIAKTFDLIQQKYAVEPDELIAAIGPAICRQCYEFGPEADELFDAKYVDKVAHNSRHVDLKAMMHDQLREGRVRQVEDLHICTMEDPRFFSHRQREEPSQTGRFFTVVSLPN